MSSPVVRRCRGPLKLSRLRPWSNSVHEAGDSACSEVPRHGRPRHVELPKRTSAPFPPSAPYRGLRHEPAIFGTVASSRKECAARTFRPRVTSHFDVFLKQSPPPLTSVATLAASVTRSGRGGACTTTAVDWSQLLRRCTDPKGAWKVDQTVRAPVGISTKAGAAAALRALGAFLHRLPSYASDRNDPTGSAQSGLSPYLHFGQLSPQRAAIAAFDYLVENRSRPGVREGVESFIEELIVRRELSDNFCMYEKDYDRVARFSEWARQTCGRPSATPSSRRPRKRSRSTARPRPTSTSCRSRSTRSAAGARPARSSCAWSPRGVAAHEKDKRQCLLRFGFRASPNP